MNPKVYILLVNYNGHHDTTKCLNSLLKITYDNYNILIIDNASENKSLENICDWLESSSATYNVFHSDNDNLTINKEVTIIKSGINSGFGGANNIGFRIASMNNVPLVLLLNNDTIVQEDFLDRLVNTAVKNERTGMVGGKIYVMNSHRKIWYCGGWIDYVKGAAYHVEEDLEGKIETTLITGCLALINMMGIKDIGCFDERFFLNVEDWDLSYRMRKAGWRLMIDTRAIISHKGSGSIGGHGSMRDLYYFHRNRLLFFNKHLSPMRKVLFFSCQTVLIIPAWIIKQLFIGDVVQIKAFILGTSDYFRGRFGKSKWV